MLNPAVASLGLRRTKNYGRQRRRPKVILETLFAEGQLSFLRNVAISPVRNGPTVSKMRTVCHSRKGVCTNHAWHCLRLLPARGPQNELYESTLQRQGSGAPLEGAFKV